MDRPVGLNKNAIEAAYVSQNKDRYECAFVVYATDSLNRRILQARSWLFLEAFERFFGFHSAGDKTKVLAEEMWYVESLPAERQFISPLDYQVRIFGRNKAKSIKPFPDPPASGRARFVWMLRVAMPGRYLWKEGRSSTFTEWLNGGAGVGFAPSSTINCWEMIFFAAIKGRFLQANELKAAYAPNSGDTGKIFMATFESRMTKYNAKQEPPVLQAGDIIVSNAAGEFHHVFAIANKAASVNDMKIMQLWGNGGAGVTFYGEMSEFLAKSAYLGNPNYYVLKLD